MRSTIAHLLDRDDLAAELGVNGRQVVEAERRLDRYVALVGRYVEGGG